MSTAVLLVVDLLNDFFRSGPLVERRESLVRSVNDLVATFRSHGQPIVWIRQEYATDLSDATLFMKQRGISVTIAGTEGCELLAELDRAPQDHEIVKRRYSAFFGTKLDDLLDELSPASLVVAGINTHACVRTTVIDAYQRDHVVIVADECTASYDAEHHDVTKRYLRDRMAEFLSNAEIAERLARQRKSS